MSTNATCLQLNRLDQRRDLFLGHHIPFSFITNDTLSTERKQQRWPQLANGARQSVLLLKGPKQQYTLQTDYAVPSVSHQSEILVKVVTIGLNPVDWKAPVFNFGIPSLPWINGRDLAGIVVQTSDECPRLRVGDLVIVPSTDYRDIRKAAFQEYAITTHPNAARIPSTIPVQKAASLGVAYVASMLALGVSFGLDFSCVSALPGPNLATVVGQIDIDEIPEDIREECISSSSSAERVRPGDWVAIWGASTTTGYITLQLAKLAGLKVACIADTTRHGTRILEAGADLLVDRHDPERAIQTIWEATNGQLRYAIDIVGKETATILQKSLRTDIQQTDSRDHTHLLGLTGLPKEKESGIRYHTVPIKLFHSSPAVGECLVTWLEGLLASGVIRLPEIVRAEGGLAGINAALEALRNGSVSGKRIVVDI